MGRRRDHSQGQKITSKKILGFAYATTLHLRYISSTALWSCWGDGGYFVTFESGSQILSLIEKGGELFLRRVRWWNRPLIHSRQSRDSTAKVFFLKFEQPGTWNQTELELQNESVLKNVKIVLVIWSTHAGLTCCRLAIFLPEYFTVIKSSIDSRILVSSDNQLLNLNLESRVKGSKSRKTLLRRAFQRSINYSAPSLALSFFVEIALTCGYLFHILCDSRHPIQAMAIRLQN